jgi:hypothetical protein
MSAQNGTNSGHSLINWSKPRVECSKTINQFFFFSFSQDSILGENPPVAGGCIYTSAKSFEIRLHHYGGPKGGKYQSDRP